MSGRVLLIHDDAAAIAGLKRVFARDGWDVTVAPSAADAVLHFAEAELIVLDPRVESGRGHFVLEERALHPSARDVPVLLLGEKVPGFDFPVVAAADEAAVAEQARALAGSASAELLTAAERVLAKARTDAGAERDAAARSSARLDEALREAQAEVELWRARADEIENARDAAGTELETLKGEHAQTQTALALLSREHDEAVSRRDTLKGKLDAAIERMQQRSEAAIAAEAKLAERDAHIKELEGRLDSGGQSHRAELSAAAAKVEEQLGRARRQLETAREAHRIELLAAKAHEVEQLAELTLQLEDARATALELEALLQRERETHDQARQAAATASRDALTTERASVARLKTELEATKADDSRLRGDVRALQAEIEHAHAQTKEHADRLQVELEAAKRVADRDAEGARTAAAAELEQLREELADAVRVNERQAAASSRAEGEHARLLAEAARLEGEVERLRAGTDTDRAELASWKAQLEAERSANLALHAQLSALQAAVVAERERADAAEARAAEANERIHVLESRTHLIATVEEDAAPLAIARSGTVALGELARLAVQLAASRADVRVDLGVESGTRRLWLRRGALVAAVSSLPGESIVARARRDGFVDARAAAELDEVRDGSVASLVEELRHRGLVRKTEVAGLMKRYVEELGLEALSEPVSTYRLHDEAPGAGVPLAEDVRPLPALATLALKRTLPFEAQLQLLGGSEAVPRALRSKVDAEVLGLGERERALLASVDGRRSIDTLISAAGLKPERGYQAFAVAKVTGLIDVGPPLEGARLHGADDVQQLDAMYEQVLQTDYFSILGVPRTAGAQTIRDARERLARQFDPLRWSGTEDPGVLHRARVVFETIEEAARTLQDDRLRTEYARHLR